MAKSFKEFADQIEGGPLPRASHRPNSTKCVFNGNGFPPRAGHHTKNGVWRIDSGIDAISRLAEKKNMGLFEELKVLNRSGPGSRRRYVPATTVSWRSRRCAWWT